MADRNVQVEDDDSDHQAGPLISFKVRTLEGAAVALDIQRFDDAGTVGVSVDGKVLVVPPAQADDMVRALELCIGTED